MGQYDFASLYGKADSSIFVYEEPEVDAVVESSTWGRTKDGSKGQWDVRFRVTTGPNAGRAQIKFPMTVTTDGPNAAQSLGIMFRHLENMGIPAEWVKTNPPEEQIAQAMVGKPVFLKIKVEEFEGVQRNKVRDVRPPRPGAPTTWPQHQAPQAAAYGQQPYGQPAMPGAPAPYGQISAQAAYGEQPVHPGQPTFQQPQYGQPQAPQQPFPPQPGVPPYAQPQAGAQAPWAAQPQQPAQLQPESPTAPYGQPQQPGDPWQTPAWAQPQAPAPDVQGAPPWASQPQAPAAVNGSAPSPFTAPQAPAQTPGAPWASQPQVEQQTGQQGPPPPPWAQ